jgi:2-dehydropantoate 2-reductase
MTTQLKIVIAGIGGVGGYFGGLLARAYAGNDDIEVHFIARGAHLKKIQDHGLTVIKGDVDFIAKPFLATDHLTEIGIADYIIICTKSYDLAEMLNQLAPCIGTKTVLLPLLNGVEAVEKIREQFSKSFGTSRLCLYRFCHKRTWCGRKHGQQARKFILDLITQQMKGWSY